MVKRISIIVLLLIVLFGAFIGGMFAYRSSATIRSWFERTNIEEQKEITDFYFYDNKVIYYTGEDKEITIPSSYSRVDTLSYTKYFETSSDYENYQMEVDNILKYLHQACKIIPDDNSQESLYFEGGLLELIEWLDEEESRNISDYFPATVEYYETTFYEGDDHIVEEVSEYFFLSGYNYSEDIVNFNYSKYEKVILPETIKKVNINSFNNEIVKEIIILNETQILEVEGSEDLEIPSDCKIYVPDSLYNNYLSSNYYPSEKIFKLSELENV